MSAGRMGGTVYHRLGIRCLTKRCATAIVLTVAWLGLGSRIEGEATGIPLIVVIHNDAGVPTDVLDRARKLVSSVFNDISVDVSWLDPGEFVTLMPRDADDRRAFMSSILQIRIMSPSMSKAMGVTKKSLGIAIARGGFAWIAFDKVRDSAALAGVDAGDALGYVMTHEIGHLLLPPNSHSAAGLMREELDPILIAQNRLRFLDTDALRIRGTLEEHIKRRR